MSHSVQIFCIVLRIRPVRSLSFWNFIARLALEPKPDFSPRVRCGAITSVVNCNWLWPPRFYDRLATIMGSSAPGELLTEIRTPPYMQTRPLGVPVKSSCRRIFAYGRENSRIRCTIVVIYKEEIFYFATVRCIPKLPNNFKIGNAS